MQVGLTGYLLFFCFASLQQPWPTYAASSLSTLCVAMDPVSPVVSLHSLVTDLSFAATSGLRLELELTLYAVWLRDACSRMLLQHEHWRLTTRKHGAPIFGFLWFVSYDRQP